MARMMSVFTDVSWALFGLILFMVLFAVFVIVTFLPSQVRIHRHLEKLPLNEQEPQPDHNPSPIHSPNTLSFSRGQYDTQV
jgi:hypothetical protein